MNRPALLATLSLALALAMLNAHGIEPAAPAASSTPPTASAATPAPASTAARAPRRIALPVGAETLPAEWLEAVEPGLSKLAQAPLPAAPKRVAGPTAR